MCCGQRRNALKNGNADTGQAVPFSFLNLFYSGQAPFHLRGAYTGRSYQFSPLQPVQSVDPRDAPSLLKSEHFRLAR